MPACRWRRFLVSGWLLLAVPILHAAPPQKGHAVQSGEASPETATTASDLLLSREDERRTEAMAMFASALIDEDNAETDRALEEYQKTLNLDPGYTELSVKVAYELARRGDVTEGINLLKDSIKAAPKEPLTYLYLSQLYSKYLNKPEAAIRYASQALDLNPLSFAPYLALYELYTATHNQKGARQILDRAAAIQNETSDYWLEFGGLLAQLYLNEDGTSSPEGLKKMNMAFQKALEYGQDDTDVLTRVADFYVVSRRVKEAIPLYLKIINLNANTSDPSLASVRDKLARSLNVNGQREDAIVILKQLIKDNPVRYESYELLGELYEEKGDYENALANYQQTLLLDPSLPLNHLRVADMFLKLKQPVKAVDLLNEARNKFTDLPQITYSLAVALSQAKRHQEALDTFEEAGHEAANTQKDMLNGAFFFAYGAAAEQAGRIEMAVQLLRKSIAADPANAAQACNYLGYIWIDRGENLEEAVGFVRRALELDPDNPAFVDSLGWYYFKTGQFQKAVETLQLAADHIQPEDAIVCEHLGDAFAKCNNSAQALVYWQKAMRLEPESKTLAGKIESVKQKVSANPVPVAR